MTEENVWLQLRRRSMNLALMQACCDCRTAAISASTFPITVREFPKIKGLCLTLAFNTSGSSLPVINVRITCADDLPLTLR